MIPSTKPKTKPIEIGMKKQIDRSKLDWTWMNANIGIWNACYFLDVGGLIGGCLSPTPEVREKLCFADKIFKNKKNEKEGKLGLEYVLEGPFYF